MSRKRAKRVILQQIYIMIDGEGFIKIGISAVPTVRLREIQRRTSSCKLYWFNARRRPDARSIEKCVHWDLRDKRERGEWFLACPLKAKASILRYIKRADRGDLPLRPAIPSSGVSSREFIPASKRFGLERMPPSYQQRGNGK